MPITLPPITRRRFLVDSLAAGAGLLAAASLPAAEPAMDASRWAILSDTHIWEKREGQRRFVKPAEGLAQARAEILALDPRPAGLIVCGDCVYLEGHAADYAVLAEMLLPLRQAGIPIHLVLGNHDNRANFWAAFTDAKPTGEPAVAEKHVAVVSAKDADWILLDSLDKTDVTPGVLGEAQLDWLTRQIDARADRPALVVAHHNPDKGLKSGGLKDTEPLFKILTPKKRAKAYLFGHTHRWNVSQVEGLHGINIPTTAWLFDPRQPRGWVEAALRPDGISLTLHALDKKHAASGKTTELRWRA